MRPSLAALLAAVAVPAVAVGQTAFTPGNIVVLRVGDGTNPMNGPARPGALLEINPTTGAVVQTIALPSSGGTAVTFQGTQVYGDGHLSRSGDGASLTVLGHNVAAGTTPPLPTGFAVAQVTPAGAVGVTTFPSLGSGVIPFGAATATGSSFYLGSSNATLGLSVINAGGSGTPTTVTSDVGQSYLHPQVLNGQLYFLRSDTVVRANTPLPSGASGFTTMAKYTFETGFLPTEYVLLDRNAGVPGPDTLYIAGDQGLQKFSFDGVNWNDQGGINSGAVNGAYFGVTGRVVGPNAELYLTTGEGNLANNSLQKLTDTGAFNAAIVGTPTNLGAAAGANFTYGGVAFAPTPVPEPALVLGLCAAAGAAGGAVRRARRGFTGPAAEAGEGEA